MIKSLFRKEDTSLYLITAIFGFIIILIGVLNHYYFRTFALDYGTYNFAWYDYAHFRISKCPIYFWTNDKTFFQDHFSFTFIILTPLYWVLTPIFGTYSLLMIQAMFILLGGWGTYKLVNFETKNKFFATLALVLYYTTYGRWASFIMDVNIEIILASLIPVFLYFFSSRKLLAASLVFAFLLLGRENIPLWFLFIGIFMIFKYWQNKKLRKVAILYTIISAVYFVLVFKVFIPMTESPDQRFSLFEYSALGETPFQAVKSIIKNPEKAFSLLFMNHSDNIGYNGVKLEFYFVYLVSGLLLLFFRPKYLIPFIPIIAQKMYNDNPLRWGIELYYAIEVVSILPYSVFLVLNELKLPSKISHKKNYTKYGIGVLIIIASIVITMIKFNPENRRIPWYGTNKNMFYTKAMYKIDFDAGKIHDKLKMIPEDAKVSASSAIVPHLAFRKSIYFLPKVNDAEYIAILKIPGAYPFNSQMEFDALINDYVFNNEWNVADTSFPLLILKHEQSKAKVAKKIYDFSNISIDSWGFVDNSGENLILDTSLQTNETGLNDTFSLKLEKDSIVNITNIENINLGTHLRISIWKKGGEAELIALSENLETKEEIRLVSRIIKKQEDGWEQLQLDLIVMQKLKNNALKIDISKKNNPAQAIYLDNLEISKY